MGRHGRQNSSKKKIRKKGRKGQKRNPKRTHNGRRQRALDNKASRVLSKKPGLQSRDSQVPEQTQATQAAHQLQGNMHMNACDLYLHEESDQVQGRINSQFEPQLDAQSQVALHRSIQASYQMLYDVYDYTIGMIEELEKHETRADGQQTQNSGILSHVIPVNHKKPIHDVIAGIELQLICLQAQMKSLPPEVTSQAKKGLVMQTIKWAASREAEGIPHGPVDHYCKNVLEILLFHAPNNLPSVDRAPKMKLTTEQVNEAMHQMAVQRHLGGKQDEEFHRDPTKEAKLRNKRQTEDIREGALRLTSGDPRLTKALDEQDYIPDVSMDIG